MKHKKIPAQALGFTQYLQAKDLAHATQSLYLRHVTNFLNWYNQLYNSEKEEPTGCTKKDILNYLGYLKNKKHENSTRQNTLLAISHYFTFLLKNEQVATNPTTFLKIRGTHKKKLYNIFTYEECTQLADDYYHNFVRSYSSKRMPKTQKKQSCLSKERNYLMLGLLLHQGITTRELQRITVEDLDLIKATLTITRAKKSNQRNIPLNASQIGSLLNYTQHIRPQFFEFYTIETNQLFLPLPESSKTQTASTNLMGIVKTLTKQVKTLEPTFLNFKQIRASVITHWIKTAGLRKAQYLAGHKYISSTETYLPNNLESLTEEMTKFNPF